MQLLTPIYNLDKHVSCKFDVILTVHRR